ncbi:hypothetical protein [Bdellovibrio sp. KM01]|uniref:hypothetical protein n=1 Tax=Bdellovibrio sp. KM01 TaxID=2748865 RepID=UPI0015EAA4CC|nr:hypothetical protein [Bdellovibrio sp. KM01]QLY24980.1 hypothetical protein HW988_16365 [Bdellovibrio sp. KM01]
MKLWIRVATPLMIVLSFALNAKAQYAANYGMAGTGVYGGMQQCPYNYGGGQAAVSEDDDVADLQQQIAELKKDKAEKKSDLKKAERDMKYARRDIEDVVADNYAQTLFEHMDGTKSCDEYEGYAEDFTADGVVVGEEGQQKSAPKSKAGDFSPAQWNGLDTKTNYVCNRSQRGTINPAACFAPFQVQDRKIGSTDRCKAALKTYSASTSKANKLRSDIENIDRSIEYAQDRLRDARKDALQARQDAQREQTEAGICPNCAASGNGYTYTKPQTDWTSVIANVGMGLFGTYLGYQQNKYAIENAANLGYPMNPAPSFLMGFPYLATGLTQALGGGSGVYGAMSTGIGAGGFGCAGQNGGAMGMYGPMGGANGTGMWGNPYLNGGGQMGGGIYAGGMGPWGMSGPMGGMMGGYPGMAYPGGMGYGAYPGGMGMGSIISGGAIGGAFPGGMGYGSYPGGMGYGAYPGGMGMNSFIGGGGIGSAFPGGMGYGSYPGGMGYGAYPGGMAMNSFIGGGGIGSAFPGGMGYGSYPGGMGYGAYPGGMGGYGTYTGAMTSGYAGDMGMMQMQQQMMQMQMQQQQAYFQAQMQRQQASASVVSEIMNLQQKLYYIQSGAYSGGTSYIGGSGSSGYYNTGTVTYPGGVIMGGSGTATTPVGTGVTVPGQVPILNNNGTSTGVGTGR